MVRAPFRDASTVFRLSAAPPGLARPGVAGLGDPALEDPRDDSQNGARPSQPGDSTPLELVFRPSEWPRPSVSYRPPSSSRPASSRPTSSRPSLVDGRLTPPPSVPVSGRGGSILPLLRRRDDDPALASAREQAALVQAQKLQAIGQLAAGIAHEINTPTQFVSDNIAFLQESFAELVAAARAGRVLAQAVATGAPVDGAEVEALLGGMDLNYLSDNVPRALDQCAEGLRRVTSIVSALKSFSRPSFNEKQPVDLREPIESTIVVARSEWKSVAEVETDFSPDLPAVPCLRDELGQVILNLITNAAHAIADRLAAGEPRGLISISTRRAGAHAEIRVRDTGGGIPPAIRDRVFEPFFTTKPFGKGSGQGLAIAWAVVVEKHGGAIGFEVDEGIGTTFVVRLPLGRTGLP
jgi:signal transduction histidine kinase